MVALLAARLGVPLDAGDGALAAALMAGIVMDTATFAHPNATPRTLAVSAALVAAGAPLSDISRRLYRTKPDAQLRLFGRVLDRLQTSPDGRVVWSTLTNADYPATGSIRAHSEGIIDLLAQSDTAEVAMLLKEAEDGATRLSVRTKPGGVDATVLTGRVRRRRPRARRRRLAAAADRRGGARGPRRGRAPGGRGRAGEAGRPQRRPRRRPRRREALGPDLARRRRARPAAVRRPAGSGTAARSTRSRPACCRCSSAARPASSSTTSARRSATARRSASATTSTTDDIDGERTPVDGPAGHARGRRGGDGRADRPDPPGPARTTAPSRSRAAARTSWPAPASRSSSRRATSSSTSSRSSSGTTRDPARPVAVTDVALLGRDVHPGARARPRRERSAAARTSGRSSGRRRAGSASRTPSGSRRCATARTGAQDGLRVAAAAGRRRAGGPARTRTITGDELRRLARACPTGPKTPLEVADAPVVLAVGPDGRVVAVCRAVGGLLHPHKVLVDRRPSTVARRPRGLRRGRGA